MFNKVAFLGAGSMTNAIVAGIINHDFLKKEQIFVTNRSDEGRLQLFQEQYGVQCVKEKDVAVKNADIIILSMQPFDLKEAVESIQKHITANQLVISAAAGISTNYIASLFDNDIPIIRVNPNMPASIGLSATAIAKGGNATKEHVEMSRSLFNTIGSTTVINEEDMHIVTGLSGSGPAYVYYLAEAMEKAAIELGLDEKSATDLISQTFLGAGEMLRRSEDSAQTLKEKVISPKGTTEAGINTLVENHFEKVVYECIKSARDRSIELGKKT